MKDKSAKLIDGNLNCHAEKSKVGCVASQDTKYGVVTFVTSVHKIRQKGKKAYAVI